MSDITTRKMGLYPTGMHLLKHVNTCRKTKFHTEVNAMAIEPLGSVMSYQAQQVAKPQTVTKVESAEIMDGSAAESMVKVDATTVAVAKTEEKGDGQNSNSGTANQQQSMEQLKKAVEKINKNSANSEVQFGFHDETNRVTIKIIDKESKEILKEFPAEKTLDMIAKAWELAGILVDEKR